MINPATGHAEKVTTAVSWLWALLWAPLYYAFKGIWIHAILSFVVYWVIAGGLALFTLGAAPLLIGLLYAFFNKTIVRNHFLAKGWTPAT
jgi:hypothetical protein